MANFPKPLSLKPEPLNTALNPNTLSRRAYFLGVLFFLGGYSFFAGMFSLFFLGKQHVPYILDGFRAISSGFPKKTFIPFFFLKRTKRRKEGRKEESKETRKEEGRKEGSRNEGRKERRKAENQ